MNKGIHRVAAGTKRARQMNNVGVQYSRLFVDPEIEAWNKRVEEKKRAKIELPNKEPK